MAGQIIRKGDRTSHGGTVLEGSPSDICMGQPISFKGHQTYCPKCKGNFPIAEGVMTMTFYGKGVAIAGMKTACGATLIASQFTDTVEWSSGSGSSAQKFADAVNAAPPSEIKRNKLLFDEDELSDDESVEIEHYYSLHDENGEPLKNYRYDLFADENIITKGTSYSNGKSIVITGDTDSRLVTWIDRDSADRT